MGSTRQQIETNIAVAESKCNELLLTQTRLEKEREESLEKLKALGINNLDDAIARLTAEIDAEATKLVEQSSDIVKRLEEAVRGIYS